MKSVNCNNRPSTSNLLPQNAASTQPSTSCVNYCEFQPSTSTSQFEFTNDDEIDAAILMVEEDDIWASQNNIMASQNVSGVKNDTNNSVPDLLGRIFNMNNCSNIHINTVNINVINKK